MVRQRLAALFIVMTLACAWPAGGEEAFEALSRENRELVLAMRQLRELHPSPPPASQVIAVEVEATDETGKTESYTLSTSRKHLNRLVRKFRRYQDSPGLRQTREVGEHVAGDLGSREIIAILDRLVTPIAAQENHEVPALLEGPARGLAALLSFVDRLGESNFFELLGIETRDGVSDVIEDREVGGPDPDSDDRPGSSKAPKSQAREMMDRISDGGRWRFKISGYTSALRGDVSHVKLKGQYTIVCPQLGSARLELGVQVQPFDEDDDGGGAIGWDCYIQLKKRF